MRGKVYIPVWRISMKNISVVGAGIMGHGIASAFALGSYKVTLHDVSEDALTRAHKLISEVFDSLAEAGVIDLHGSTPTLNDRIICTTNLASAAARADLVQLGDIE
jgi:3-hydroxybutyryl-CoA dehydrogenase